MRKFLIAAVILTSCHRTAPVTQAPPRDIILVTIDTWRADAAGFAGNADVKTPFLDSLAKRGTVFSNAHAHNVVTLPSHVNILTGLYPFQHGVRENAGFVLDAKYPTLATLLGRDGYATAAFIGAFPLDSRFGLNHGFDVYDDNYGKGASNLEFVVQERPAEAVLTSAVKWWGSALGRKRFMWIHLYDAHAPYHPSYLGEIATIDARLREHLAPIIGGDTLLIITGDHGEALGDHGELTHGLFAYEATLKVPLIVLAPHRAHAIDARFARHIDIAPTILAAAGISKPASMKGTSLFDRADDGDTYFEALSASLNRGWAPLTGIIHRGRKYIDLPIAELYDLSADAREERNLRDDDHRSVDESRRLLAALAAPVTNRRVSSEEVARLRSLGYVGGNTQQKTSYSAEDDPKRLIAIDSKMHRAIDAYTRGDLSTSVTVAREVVAARPGMSAGRELLAFVLEQSEHVDEAIAQLRKSVPTEDVKVQLALMLSSTGRSAEAVALLAPLASGNNPDVLNAYGVALADEGKPADAIRQFERVLAIDPNNAPALQNLGIVALRGDDVNRSRDYLTRALALNPRLPLALNTLGVVHARSGDLSGAVDLWRRAVAIDPRQYDALFNIAAVESRAGHREEARKALTQFVQTAPPQRYARDIAAARQALLQLQ
ncbi:MAG TPA: sulfatase-like hydrolase/transferase [Thermoanaerobaculia bacterium]|nr:sulfatase-like hydrolase/transferase [Thermoanaerobaculia bacterium]